MKPILHGLTILVMALGLWPPAQAQTTHFYFTGLRRPALDSLIVSQRALGRELVDIERIVSSTNAVRFDAIFAPLPSGQVSALIDETEANYNNFLNTIGTNGRLIDLEVDDAAGAWRFSVLFWHSGETDIRRDVRSRRTRTAFRALLESQARSNYSLVDVEVSARNGNLYYSGVWQSHPGQPRTVLYHDLAYQELGGILNYVDPRLTAGRVLDFERYHDPALGADRFAVLVAPVEAADERLSRDINRPTLDNVHANTADAQTHLIDLESYYDSNGDQKFDALWGPGKAALVDVAPVRRDDVAMPRSITLDDLIGQIDSGATRLNNFGLFGLNLRTRQSVTWRADELFPLASVVKLAIHARLYRDAGLGLLDLDNEEENFTTCSACTNPFQPYWVDARSWPGMGCADRGKSFSLARFAEGMMTVSDNAATGALLLRDDGLARQSYSINDWMADLDGISQGWGPIISIAEQDRITYWRGQWSSGCVPPTARADSFLRAPLSAIEVHHRPDPSNSNIDSCDGLFPDRYLVSHFDPNPVPAVCFEDGERQFHDMGLNSATPRALSLFYEALATGQLVADNQLGSLFAAMGGPDRLTIASRFPVADEVYSKGGTEGSRLGSEPTKVVADSSLLRIGNDWYVLAILGKHVSFTTNSLRNWSAATSNYPAIAKAMLEIIAPDLRLAASPPVWQSATTLPAGAAVQLQLRVRNHGGGDASPFRVSAHVSTNVTITGTDPQIAFKDTSSLSAGSERTLTLVGTLPANLAPGSYCVGWRLDPPLPGQPSTNRNGQVGEWDETSTSNAGVVAGLQLIVTPALPQIFDDGFE